MNKLYKTIWNDSLHAWTPVHEHATAQGKSSRSGRSSRSRTWFTLSAVVLGIWGAAPPPAMANTINTAQGCSTTAAGTIGRTYVNGTKNGPADGSGTSATVAGCEATGSGATGATVYGALAKVTAVGGTALGVLSLGAKWGTGLGLEAQAFGTGSTAIGFGSRANGLNSVSIGGAGGNGTTALSEANSTVAGMSGSVAIGSNEVRGAQVIDEGTNGVAIGAESTVTRADGVALGRGAQATGTRALALGAQSQAQGLQGLAFGNRAQAIADQTTAIGNDAVASGYGAVAIGGDDLNGGDGSYGGSYSPARASGYGAVVLGARGSATKKGSVALGTLANSTGEEALALGTSSSASHDRSVALGTRSQTAAPISTASGVVNGKTYNYAGAVADSVASVGNGTLSRQVTNVAAGRVSSASTDAINGSQLAATNQAVDSLGTNVTNLGNSAASAIGGGVRYDPASGNLSQPTYQIAGGTQNNISDAIDALNKGWNVQVNGDTATGVAAGDTVQFLDGRNVALTRNGRDITVGTTPDLTADSVTTGNTRMDSNGVTIAGGPSMTSNGVDAGGKPITNVAPGVAGTDAANVDQVNAIGNRPMSFAGNEGTAVDRKLGETLALKGDATTAGTYSGANVKTVTDPATGAVNLQLADAPVFESVTTGNTKIDNNGLTISGGPSVTAAGVDAAGKKVTGVADGTAATDAVNRGQLDNVSAIAGKGWNVQTNGDTATNVAPGDTVQFLDGRNVALTRNGRDITVGTTPDLTADSVTTGNTRMDSNGVTIAGGPSMTAAGVDAGGKPITDVAPGVAGTDAANVDQVNAIGNRPMSFAGNEGTAVDRKLGETLTLKGEATTAGTYSGANVKTVTDPATGAVNLQLADAPVFDAVTTGSTRMDSNGLTISGGPSVTAGGVDAGGKPITNVAPGTNGTDAANVDQVNAIGNRPMSFAGNEGTAVDRKLGETLTLKGEATTAGTYSGANVKTVTDPATGAVNLQLADAPVFDAVTTGNTRMDSNGVTISGGPSVTAGGVDAGGKPITNVAPGTNGTDAANVDQVNAIGNRPMSFAGNEGAAVDRKLGETLTLKGDATTAGTYSGANVKTVTDPATGAVNLQLADAPVFDAVTTGNTRMDSNGVTIAGGPSITAGGVDAGGKPITNVAPGTNGTDAANVDQVNAIGNRPMSFAGNEGAAVDRKLGETLTLKGEATTAGTYSGANIKTVTDPATGAVNLQLADAPVFDAVTTGNTRMDSNGVTIAGGPSVTAGGVDAGGKPITNVAPGVAGTDAANVDQVNAVGNRPMSFAGNEGAAVDRKLGETLALKGDATTAGTYSGANVKTVTDPATGAVNLQLADAPVFESVTTGNTKIDNNGLTISGGPSVMAAGVDAAGKKVTGVADGTAATDAVNRGQLDNVSAIAGKGWNIQANGDTATNVAPGDTVQFLDGRNVALTRNGRDITVGTTPDLMADSVTTGSTRMDGNGLTIAGGPSVTAGGVNAGGKPITNVAPGTNGTDAANVDQVTAVGNRPMSFAGNEGAAVDRKLGETLTLKGEATTAGTYSGANVKTVTDPATGAIGIQLAEAPVFESVTTGNTKIDNNGLTISGGPSVTAAGVDAAGKKVTGVADGTAATDAVNRGQLDSVSAIAGKGWNVQTNGDTATNVAPGDTVQFLDGRNMALTRNGRDITVGTTPDLTADSVTTGNTRMDGNGLTIAGGPSITAGGVDAGSKPITNVAPGVAGTDAANVDQVNAIGNRPMSFAGNEGTAVDRKLGETLTLKGDATTAGTYSGANIKTVTDPATGAANLQLADAPVFNGTVKANGFDANGHKITNVADGTTASDAVNRGQLDNVSAIAGKGWNIQANGDTATNVAPGDTVQFLDGRNVALTRNGRDITVGTTPDLTADSVTTGNTRMDSNGLAIAGGPSMTVAGVNAGGKPITNVAPGTNGTDAANVDQVNAIGNRPMSFAGNEGAAVDRKLGETLTLKGEATTAGTYSGANVKTVTDPATGAVNLQLADAPVFESVTTGNTKIDNNGLTISGGPSVTTAGVDAAGKKVTGVADGTAATDAVNRGQLDNVSAIAGKGWNIQANGDTATNVAPGDTVQFLDGRNVALTRNGRDITVGTTPDLTADSVTTGNTRMDSNGVTIAGGPSMTAAGVDAGGKPITDVAPGVAGTDAANVDQVNAIGNRPMSFAGNEGTAVDRKLGETLTLKGEATTAGTYSGANVKTVTDPATGAIGIQLADAPVFNGMVKANGFDANGNKITNVAAGTAATDAVNMDQLQALAGEVDAGRTRYYSVNSKGGGNERNDGASGADAIAAGQDARASGNRGVALGANAQAPDGNSVALGADSVTRAANPTSSATVGGLSFGGFAGANPFGVVSVGGAGTERQLIHVAAGRITVDSTDAINGSQLYASVRELDAKISSIPAGKDGKDGKDGAPGVPGPAGPKGDKGDPGADGDAQGAVRYTKNPDGSYNRNEVTLNPDGNGPTTITNVADGKNAGDAVNKGQLDESANRWVTGNPTNHVAPKATGKDATAVGSGAVAGGTNSVALGANSNDGGRANVVSVGSAGNERQVTNVAPGTQGTDAVNVNQLNSASAMSAAYTDARAQVLGNEIRNVARTAYAGVAAAMAVQMPGNYVAGKTVMRAGAAVFKGESAVGVSFRRTSDNSNWSLTGGVGLSRAGASATVGVEWVMD